MTTRIALFGATGFMGAAVGEALAGRPDIKVEPIPTPRLTTTARTVNELTDDGRRQTHLVELSDRLRGIDVVVNAAGDPDASSLDKDTLFGANALLPALLVEAAHRGGVRRFVHVSSAVVQNDKAVLDSGEDVRPFSAYSASKAAGEKVLLLASTESTLDVVRYRPPSVHAPSRRVTRMIAGIARSPAGTVARPGDQPTPQALVSNVASAVAFLALTETIPPRVVHHPSEGVTVSSLMTDLSGGRRPVRIPRWLARLLVRCAKGLGRFHPATAANARRVELLWLGQRQADSWLTEAGWSPEVGREGWQELGREVNS